MDKSIAESLFDILSDKLNNKQIKTEEDIILIIDTKKGQITGMLSSEVDTFRIVFEDQSLLSITLCGGDKIKFDELEMSYGYFIPHQKVN